jgi:hypothetical protein
MARKAFLSVLVRDLASLGLMCGGGSACRPSSARTIGATSVGRALPTGTVVLVHGTGPGGGPRTRVPGGCSHVLACGRVCVCVYGRMCVYIVVCARLAAGAFHGVGKG